MFLPPASVPRRRLSFSLFSGVSWTDLSQTRISLLLSSSLDRSRSSRTSPTPTLQTRGPQPAASLWTGKLSVCPTWSRERTWGTLDFWLSAKARCSTLLSHRGSFSWRLHDPLEHNHKSITRAFHQSRLSYSSHSPEYIWSSLVLEFGISAYLPTIIAIHIDVGCLLSSCLSSSTHACMHACLQVWRPGSWPVL